MSRLTSRLGFRYLTIAVSLLLNQLLVLVTLRALSFIRFRWQLFSMFYPEPPCHDAVLDPPVFVRYRN